MPCLRKAFVCQLNKSENRLKVQHKTEQNYFELFELPQAYQLDLAVLTARYRELQRTLHPDRHANTNEREQLLAVQYTATVNDAYNTLKHPVQRALYMLDLQGAELDMENTTLHDPQFLMQQMELREALSEIKSHADPEAELEKMAADLRQQQQAMTEDFAQALTPPAALAEAQKIAVRMQFNDKLQREIDQLEEELLDM